MENSFEKSEIEKEKIRAAVARLKEKNEKSEKNVKKVGRSCKYETEEERKAAHTLANRLGQAAYVKRRNVLLSKIKPAIELLKVENIDLSELEKIVKLGLQKYKKIKLN